jgi:2-amino-4-hydroxy-6-hydroxymethyldihydropteridine diphosphokinase
MKSSFHVCYIAAGSNKGNKFESIQKAVKFIEDDENIRLLNVSSVYETSPFGNVSQDNFYNAVIEIITSLPPIQLLNRLKEIEKEVGRTENIKWGPREIDLDIVLYEDFVIDEENIKIPHLGMYERDFFLIPLIELNDKILDPKSGKSLSELLNNISRNNIISKLSKPLSFKEKSFEEKS